MARSDIHSYVETMRNLPRRFLSLLLVGLTALLVALPATPADAQVSIICHDDPVPSGYVVTKTLNRTGCSDSVFPSNARRVQPARNGLRVCDGLDSEIPSPFVVASRTRDGLNCDSTGFGNNNVSIIQEARAGLVACHLSVLPPGFSWDQPRFDGRCNDPSQPERSPNAGILRGRSPAARIAILAATGTADGVLHQRNGVGAFALATTNTGGVDWLTVSARTSGITASVILCQTDPATARCLESASGAVTTRIDAGETPTFSVFVGTVGTIPLNPSQHNVSVDFRDRSGVIRGTVTVPVTTD